MATSCASRRTWAFAKQADHAPHCNIAAFGLLDRPQLRGGQNKGTGHACILRSTFTFPRSSAGVNIGSERCGPTHMEGIDSDVMADRHFVNLYDSA
jgi:hypothetical protein